ncbi:MAG: response regulator transcription factor [Hydrogenophaga sp.]|uniref:response regulator transcription factor n=1 Tax=Hydrogenophaga intermedia TaxID=65786 RepID=UPI002043BAA4|nr:response regulator [Hydrogenophaga intermedia]
MSASTRPLALVVEDDDHIAHLLRFMLEREGYEVLHAVDGREGVRLIETGAVPAVALLDVMLPFVDGFELVRRLRAQAGWADVPVVMLTAKTQESDIVRALDAGANDYILKPFQPAELLARLRRFSKGRP